MNSNRAAGRPEVKARRMTIFRSGQRRNGIGDFLFG
jgi:hypothetical protein